MAVNYDETYYSHSYNIKIYLDEIYHDKIFSNRAAKDGNHGHDGNYFESEILMKKGQKLRFYTNYVFYGPLPMFYGCQPSGQLDRKETGCSFMQGRLVSRL